MTSEIDGRAVEPAGCPMCGAMEGTRLWVRHGFTWWRCARDGMVWVAPRLTPEAVGSIYAAGHAAKAAGLGPRDRAVPARYRAVAARLAAMAGGPGRLLEVGAFDGLFLEAARAAGWDVAGTEIDADAAVDARRRGAVMHVGPLATAPFAPGVFDAVALRDVIEHLPDPRGDLARIAALLRPGGALYVWTPNFDSLTRRIYGQRWGAVVFPWHFSYFTAATLRAMLEGAGFDVVSLATRNLLLRRADPYAALGAAAAVTDGAGGPGVDSGADGAGGAGDARDAGGASRAGDAGDAGDAGNAGNAGAAGRAGARLGPSGGSRRPPLARRIERILARLANPVFARLDAAGWHWGAQIEVFAIRRVADPDGRGTASGHGHASQGERGLGVAHRRG